MDSVFDVLLPIFIKDQLRVEFSFEGWVRVFDFFEVLIGLHICDEEFVLYHFYNI